MLNTVRQALFAVLHGRQGILFRSNTCGKYREEAPLNHLSLAAALMCLVLSSSSASGQTTPPDSPTSPFANGAANVPSVPPHSAAALLDRARTLLQAGSVDEAARIVRQCLDTHPDCEEGHFLLGHVLFHEIQSEARLETQSDRKQVLEANPFRAKYSDEKAKASLAEFTAGARFHAPNAADLKVVAFDYVLLGDYVDADKWLTRMLSWTPNDSEGWYYLGRAKYNENRFSEAIDAFEQSLKLDPRNVKTEDNLGLSYTGLNRREEALASYKTAISWQAEIALKDPGPYINLGSLLLDQGRPQEAVPYLLQAIEVAPHESKAHELLGQAYTRLGDLRKAQIELETAIELSPQSGSLHCMLAPVYHKQGQADKAKIESESCATLAGSHSIPETPRP